MKNKNTFLIGELSDLFDISVDSIRYYEKVGLITPTRNSTNGYRQYTLDDVQTLVLIRELMGLGFPSQQILSFVKNRTLNTTIGLLQSELSTINEQILSLYEAKSSIQNRLSFISSTLNNESLGKVLVLDLPARPGIMITDEHLKDEYIDYCMVNFMKQTHHQINTIGACDCYTLDIENSSPDSDYYVTQNVFFLTDTFSKDNNYTLPAGLYLSISYRGSLTQTKQLTPKLYTYAKQHGYEVTGNPIELCHIDSYETVDEAEYLTEVQLPVIPK